MIWCLRVKEFQRVTIAVPDLGAARVTFGLWHVRVGDRVTAGDRVAEVLLPGAVFDVPAPASGTLAERTAQPGTLLTVGQVIGEIQEEEN